MYGNLVNFAFPKCGGRDVLVGMGIGGVRR